MRDGERGDKGGAKDAEAERRWRAYAFDAALDAVPSAAFVVDAQGAVRHANRAGRAWLDEEPARRAGALRAAVTGDAGPFRVDRLPQGPDEGVLHLVVLEAAADSTVMPVAPVAADPAHLTVRERDVLDLLAHGATYDEIARMLGIATNTVRSHVRSLYEKLHASSKTEAVREGIRLGYLVVPGELRAVG